MGFWKKIRAIVANPPIFVREIKNGEERWGEIKRTHPAAGVDIGFFTLYDITWEDGTSEKDVPTHRFQWDGLMYTRHL